MLHKNVIEPRGFRTLDLGELEVVSGGQDAIPDGDVRGLRLTEEPLNFYYERATGNGPVTSVSWVENAEGGAYVDQQTGRFIDADGRSWNSFDDCVQSNTDDLVEEQQDRATGYMGPVGPLGQLVDDLFERGDRSLVFTGVEQTMQDESADHCANG